MRILGSVCKYPCRMLCDLREHASICRMVKEIAFCYSEQVQYIRLDVNASKGRSEEVSKLLDVSLIHIDTYHFDGEITLLIGHKRDSYGGGATDRLYVELKTVVHICALNCNSYHQLLTALPI